MDRRNFLKGIGGGLISTIIAPEFMTHILIKQYELAKRTVTIAPRPENNAFEFDNTFEPAMRITAVGIGQFASRMTEMLSKNIDHVTCLALMFDPDGHYSTDISTVLTTIRQSDLLFVLSAFDDQSCDALFELLTSDAHESGVLTVGIIPDNDPILLGNAERLFHLRYLTTLFHVSAQSFRNHRNFINSGIKGYEMLTGYALRHVVTTIANLLTQLGMICVDFADVVSVLKSAGRSHMGVGVAGGDGRGREAARMALESLREQRVSPEGVKGVLACVNGGQSLTMDDYEDVSHLIHGYAGEDTNILIGLYVEELMGDNARVTVMAVG